MPLQSLTQAYLSVKVFKKLFLILIYCRIFAMLKLNMAPFLLNHIALSVKNVDASIEFYQKVFQFEEIENTASNSKTRWLSLGEGRQLHLIPRPNLEVITNKAVHFALSTSNLEEFVKHLVHLEIEYSDWTNTIKKDYVRKDGVEQFYFQDLDGYWIEVNNAIQ